MSNVCWALVQDGNFGASCVDKTNWEGFTAELIAARRSYAGIASMLHQARERLCDPNLSVVEVLNATRSTIKKSGRSRLMEFAAINEEDPEDVAERSNHILAQFGPLAQSCILLIDDIPQLG